MTGPAQLNVQVIWGPRAEHVTSVNARWAQTRHALAAISPLLAGWFVFDDETGLDEAVTAADDLQFAAYAGQDAAQQIAYSGTAGTGTLNGALVAIHPGTLDEAREWVPLLEPVLAALVAA